MYEYICPNCGQRFGMPDAARLHREYELDKWSLGKLRAEAENLDLRIEKLEARIDQYEYDQQKESA